MGCCCTQPKEDVQQKIQNPNVSKVFLNEQKQASPQISKKYKDEGKKHFNSGNFNEAIKSYEIALLNDPNSIINYTNLALAQKAAHKFEESILTISKMEQIIPNKNNLGVYQIKGKIIKARCQSILVKNFCTTNSNLTNQKAHKLISQSKQTFKQLLQNNTTKQIAQNLNANQYLQNTKKIQKILLTIKNNSNNQLQQYLSKKLKTAQANNYFKQFNMQKYFENPIQILKQIQHLQKQNKKQYLNYDDNQQQFIIDPITYQQFVDPILVKSGLTYQESVLKSHYEKNGSFDPITKQKYQELGVRNNTLKTYINQTKKIGRAVNELKYLEI